MREENYRPHGRYLTAEDIAERLMPDLDMNEALLWPPDLFALTSYMLAKTSAYQLVVSPPAGKKWPPLRSDIESWLCVDYERNIKYWHRYIKKKWGGGNDPDFDIAKYEPVRKWGSSRSTEKTERTATGKLRKIHHWEALVRSVGNAWRKNLRKAPDNDFSQIDDSFVAYDVRAAWDKSKLANHKKMRERKLLEIANKNTPPLLLACWAFFFKAIMGNQSGNKPLPIADLLCNQDHLQNPVNCNKLWAVSQALLTLHAIADFASAGFGLYEDPKATKDQALIFADSLLIGGRIKYDPVIHIGGSLSTFNIERCRVLPKRHNPSIGITLRSLSSNLAFHQSAVDVVWRKTVTNNRLGSRLTRATTDTDNDVEKAAVSVLLLPFPLSVKAKDFREDKNDKGKEPVRMSDQDHGFFTYEPFPEKNESEEEHILHDAHQEADVDKVIDLIKAANEELPNSTVDMILFPEAALSLEQFNLLKGELTNKLENHGKAPSVVIAGVRESKDALMKDEDGAINRNKRKIKEFNFPRNAVYCQYLDTDKKKYYEKYHEDSELTAKYKQYKHHRWRFDSSQIRRYGLSSVLDPKKVWWESIKIPKRRVSFLNVGDRLTISHLICEDLARQDPIAELVRAVGPSLVIAILMDGPQLRNRWSSRYATVLSEDPGSSVITLTSLGMVKRYQSEFGKASRTIGLWNDNRAGDSREIELAQGAEAVLLTLSLDREPEKTADGREEEHPTSVLHLNDVIQIYLKQEK
ncbi:MAG TPA: hypothetical protein PLL77_14170 [Pyrinomonadaceae bacterium]|nr:hypothetical protein [Pyrinomonadaceae bacterium]